MLRQVSSRGPGDVLSILVSPAHTCKQVSTMGQPVWSLGLPARESGLWRTPEDLCCFHFLTPHPTHCLCSAYPGPFPGFGDKRATRLKKVGSSLRLSNFHGNSGCAFPQNVWLHAIVVPYRLPVAKADTAAGGRTRCRTVPGTAGGARTGLLMACQVPRAVKSASLTLTTSISLTIQTRKLGTREAMYFV